MKFGPVPTREAAGAISAHSLGAEGISIRKGAILSAAAAERLAEAGIETLVAARPEAGDIGEDEAAARLAGAVAGPGVRVERPFTGRANLYATETGLLVLDSQTVDRINAVDESVTLATLSPYRPVRAGEMIATVKIIPYAVPGATLDAAVRAAGGRPCVEVARYRVGRVGVISTLTPGFKARLVPKTVATLRRRLSPSGAEIVREAAVAHSTAALGAELRRTVECGAELAIVFGASAIADRRDVIPSAIEAAGGEVLHLGMPVDPGNLLLVGRIGPVPVIGAPGCARSPKENGFDWVLRRLLAGLEVSRRDIMGMGVGGLLLETPVRGQPREGGTPDADAG